MKCRWTGFITLVPQATLDAPVACALIRPPTRVYAHPASHGSWGLAARPERVGVAPAWLQFPSLRPITRLTGSI